MVIQAWCSTPPSLPTIVGIAVETMVWSRLDNSMPAIRAEKMIQMRFWVSSSGPAAGVVRTEVLIAVLWRMGRVGGARLRREGEQGPGRGDVFDQHLPVRAGVALGKVHGTGFPGDVSQEQHGHPNHRVVGGHALPGGDHPGELGFPFLGGSDEAQHQLGFLLDDADQLTGLFFGGVHVLREVERELDKVTEQRGGDFAGRRARAASMKRLTTSSGKSSSTWPMIASSFAGK